MPEIKNKPFFISVEGGEAAGKSTFCRGLVEALQQRGIQALATFEPGGTPAGSAIRQLFLEPPGGKPLDPHCEMLLVGAARSQHVAEVIKPALAKGSWVICDRYSDSTRVYQGMLGGVDNDGLEAVLDIAQLGVEPEVTFYLDCPVEVIGERLAQRQHQGDMNRFDAGSLDWHQKLRDCFLELSSRNPHRFKVLDATLGKQALIHSALGHLGC